MKGPIEAQLLINNKVWIGRNAMNFAKESLTDA